MSTTTQRVKVDRDTAARMLRKIDASEAELNTLGAQYTERLQAYEALIDRMKGSELWPDTVEELRSYVEAERE